MMEENKEIRLECLKLSLEMREARNGPEVMIERAENFYEFVIAKDAPAAKAKTPKKGPAKKK